MINVTIKLGDALDLLARVANDDGTHPALASISTITLAILNTTTGQQISTTPLNKATVMTSTPTLNDDWREDDVGFNFRHIIDASTFGEAGNYIATVSITTTLTTSMTWVIQVKP